MEDKMLKLCKRVIENGGYINSFGDDCKGINCFDDNCIFNGFEKSCSESSKECLKIAQEYIDKHEPKKERNDNMEKTFREAIADIDNIKKDEFYICKGDKNLKITKNGIDLEGLDWTNAKFIGFGSKFILQRKQYDFIEAFNSYEEGFEIEDMHGCKFKKIDGVDSYKMKCDDYFTGKSDDTDFWFGFEEIRGKWYINK